MALIPALLGVIGKPFQMAYKVSRLVLRLHTTRKTLEAIDYVASFFLDVTGKVKISLALLVIKYVDAKRRCQALANKTSAWITEHRTAQRTLAKDLETLLSDSTGPQPDPLTRAGVLFLRDCLARIDAGDEFARRRFPSPVDQNAVLVAFYSTGSSYRLAEVLREPSPSTGSLQNLLDKVYEDLRLALRRELLAMFVL